MKTSTRIALLTATAAAWGGSMALLKIILPLAVGATVINQMASSNSSYFASLGFSSVASIATGFVTVVFAGLAILVLRAK